MLLLVMIMSIGAISAADANETLQGEVSDTNIALTDEVGDTNIATTSSDLKQEVNDTSPAVESVNDVDEINVDDSRNENHKVGVASSASDDVLSATNDDLLKHSSKNFYYDGTGEWYYDLEDAWSAAEGNNGGTIKVWAGYYKYSDDDDDFEYKVNTAVTITLQPYGNGPVTFDGSESGWFLRVTNNNVKVTINDITFKNLKGRDGGAIEVEDSAQLTLNGCIFESNHASSDGVSYGLGGAIVVDEGTLVANNCRFINNKADRYGGAICIEDGGSVTLNSCYFEGNKKGSDANDFDDYDIDSDKSADWSFENCLFIGQGSLEIEVDAPAKSVEITPDVEDEGVNLVVLYKDGSYYTEKPWASFHSVEFTDLEKGTYTVYMMKDHEKRYIYSGTEFTIIEPYFVLDDKDVFETLSAAVNAIPNGGSGVITVEAGTYTDSSNFNVQIRNKVVTIMPKIISEYDDTVIFEGNSQNYLLDVGANAQLILEDITITGKFSNAALIFTSNLESSITDCEFNNIKNSQNQPGTPIDAQNSKLALNDTTFDLNGHIILKNTIATIEECTFTNNTGEQGGAINANPSSDLTITSSEFTRNDATTEGGAIYATNLKIEDSTFMLNTAETGGAIYITDSSDSLVNITSCVFDSNIATDYRNIYSKSSTRKFNLDFNEYDLNLSMKKKDASYGSEYILNGAFDWGSNLNNTFTLLSGTIDDENVFGDLLTVEDNKFNINLGVLSGGTHELAMEGMYTQGDSNDHFYTHVYYSDLNGNEFYLTNPAYLKVVISKAKILLNLEVKDVLIPEIPVLNLYANWDNNYTIFIGNKYYKLEVVNGKGSMQLTGLDLGNYSVVAMRDADENFDLAMNFTTFSVSKTYSNFLVVSTNVEYDTLAQAVANSGNEDTIYVKNGTYKDTKVVISNKTLDIIALETVVFDAQGSDANFIIVNKNAEVYIYGIAFRGIHNRNTNYGAIVNHGYLSLDSCNFTDNKITKTSFAGNGGAAIFSDGESLEIDNCNFINNVAPLKVSTAAVTSLGYEDISITDSKFINNTAREGGAVHFKNIAQFESAIYSCDFEQNTAVKGSAIYVGNNSRYASVSLSNFVKNNIKNSLGEKAQLEGGVIYVNANTTEVTIDIGLSNFENNANKDVDGGVLCLDGSSNAFIEGCAFNNNSGKLGSAILIKNPNNEKLTLLIDSSSFTDNHATTGAVATSPKVIALIEECIFINNTGENRHVYSNGFTVAHDTVFEVSDANLKASTVSYGNNSIIKGTANPGVNIYTLANLTIDGENVTAENKNNAFTYNAGVLNHGKHTAVLNNIVDMNNNTYLMDSISITFKVNRIGIELNVSVDNITYGETLKVVETLPSTASGRISYQLNGKEYTKDELESLKLDAGKYTLVATYNNEDYAPSSSTVNFEVYKANPTISVEDVEVEDNGTVIVNIKTNVPSIYTIEIGDYKTDKYVNGSRAVEIDEIFEPGTYTIKVTSQERVNYKSNSTEATLKVTKNIPVVTLNASNKVTSPNEAIVGVSAPENAVGNITYTITDSNKNIVKTLTQSCRDDLIVSDLDDGDYEINAVFEGDDLYYSTSNIKMAPLSIMRSASNVNILSEDEDDYDDEYNYPFIYQEDEDSDYEYYETLEEAIDAASLMGGIITVRGGTYCYEDGNAGIDIEGEAEITIRAFAGEEVIFDCQHESDFLYLTYDTEVEIIEAAPPIPIIYTTEGPTITLENITVINGYANSDGGVIEMDAGTLTLLNCNFYNNEAEYGGVIYIGSVTSDQDADVIAYNTTFINNIARSEGGAIYISEGLEQFVSASFYACTFLDNYQGEDDERTMNYFAGDAADEIVKKACIFNAKDTVNWSMDKINQTITVIGTSTDVFDSIVLLYFDYIPLYSIYNNGSQTFNVTFEDVMGGNYTIGVMNDHDLNTYIFKDASFEMIVPNFIISADEVYENLTDAIGNVTDNGIIYANANYHIDENMEIDISKSFTLTNFRDRVVVFDGNSTNWFFTVAEGCNVVIENIEFVDGGIKDHASIENYGSLTLKNCSFTGFETETIIYNSGSLNITDGVFSLNSINNAIVLNNGKLFIDGAEFSSNVINTNSVVYNNGNAEIVASNFTENINNGNGGAIYNKNSLTIKDTVFNENEGINGGAVYNEGTLEVLNSTFEDNTANGYGGAIFNDGEANIANSSFSGSFSAKDGGAIYNNNMLIVNNSTLVANTATGNGGAIYNNKTLKLTESFFGINFAYEFANIYNAGDVQEFSNNTFDFYDVILYVPDGEYGIPTTITGTLDPQFNMDLQLTLPGFVNYKDADVTITDGIFEYNTGVLPKGAYDVILNEVIYDKNGNVYYGESIRDRLIVNKANVYINLTVEDIILKNADKGTPVLKINASKNGTFQLLFNNKLTSFTIADTTAEITLDSVGEGNYSVMVVREGDENYNDAANGTTFTVSEYMGNFIVNSTGGKFDTLVEAIRNSAAEDIIYVMEGSYSNLGNLGVSILGKKLSIISLGEVIFDANSTILMFIAVNEGSDVTICDAIFTGFDNRYKETVFLNRGNLTFDGCTFVKNNLVNDTHAGTNSEPFKGLIYSEGNLSIVNSEFYDNKIYHTYLVNSKSDIIINESTFENNTIDSWGRLINITNANSAKVISTEFVENTLGSGEVISVERCNDVLINAEFYDNTKGWGIFARNNSNLNIENSIFTGNSFSRIIETRNNVQNSISGCTFSNNTVNYIVLSEDKNLSVSESSFLANTLSDNPRSGESALFIGSNVNASVNECVFADNKGGDCRNIYSENPNVNITNTTFDTANVDYAVSDIDYGQTEIINGTIDIGTNFGFTVNLNINNKVYPVKVTNNNFTYTLSNLTGGDYDVVLNAQNRDSNTFVFNQITKTFTVNRIDPGLKVTISNITQGEKLEVNATLINNATDKILYQLDGKWYNKTQLENLTLTHGNYLVAASYGGNKNYYPVGIPVYVEVYKTTPNITVSDAEANYGEDIEINVKVDVADYYTVFINDSYDDAVSLYIDGSGTFTVPSKNFKPGKYEIKVYKIETDDYNEAYGYANLTVNENIGIFNISNDTIYYGENATVSVKVPENAYGNITYTVYDSNMNPVYTITQSCLEELVVPNLYVVDNVGKYLVTGTYEGDSYYTNKSIVYSGIILVMPKAVELNITVSNITYGEKAVVTVGADADGEYLVYVGNETYKVTVVNGSGNISVSDLIVGSYTVNATAIDGNYSAFEEAVFEVTSKQISVVVSVEDITYGDNATVVVQSDVDGEYIVSIRGENYTVSVNDGEGVKYIPDLNVGKNIFVSVTVVDGNYSAYNTTTFNVNKQDTPIELDIVTGENNVTMTVTVDEAATGLVKFQVTGEEEYTLYVDVIDGQAVLEDILDTGDYRVIVTYMGDNRFNTNITSEEFTLKGHIKKDTPITADSKVNGYRVTLTVKVDENATGFVRLTVGGTVANIEVVDGVATLTTSLMPNSYTVDVTYLGDDNYNTNSTIETFTVTEISKENTTIDLNIDVYEDTALVMVDINEAATGLVKFYMVGKESGEEYTMYMDVIDGHVETFTNSIEPGNYTVVATYMGDSVFNTNTTSQDVEILGHVMKDTPIDVTVETNANRVTLTVKVDENATGFVEVKSGLSVSNIALENGESTLTTVLPYGSYTLDVTYLGDYNYNKNSTKAEFTLVEPKKENTPIALDIVTDEYYVGMTATVSDKATGLVKFQVSGAEEYVVYSDVINGVAILEDTLIIGDYSVVATYMGDSRFNTNITYGDFTIKGHIKKDTPISASADVLGNRVTLTVKVDDNATGFVKLTVGGTVTNIEVVDGVATLTTVLVPNSYFVDVTYLGDDDYNMNSTKVTFTVTEASKKNTNINLDIITGEDNALIMVDLNKATTGLVKLYMLWKETGEEYTMYMDVIDGHVETFTNSIEPGNYTIVATYMGDSAFNTNTTSQDVEIFGHVLKDTPITASVVSSGTRVALTVKVDDEATGFVELKFGDNVFNIALEDGIGTLTTSLPYGSYSLDITYLGDENYNMNSTTCDFTIVEPAKESTPISLDIVTDEYYVGMTATVSDVATGLIKFQVIGSTGEYTLYADVIDGKAILEDTLPIGDYRVIATYMGDNRFNTNITSGEFTISGHIKKDTPISARAVVNGNRVTLTVKVDDDATGFVKLAIGGTVTNIEIVDGVATLTTVLVPNSYLVDVTYLGDDDFNMNNTRVTFTVTDVAKKDTPIDLNVTAGEDTIWITVDLDKDATGLVKLYMVWKETGENITAYMDVIDGHVETLTNSLLPGNYSVVATYMGDSLFNTNTTFKDVEIIGHVMKDTPITADVVANGNRVTLTVKVDENATGFVELLFGDNVFNIALKDGIGKLTTSLPYGSYSLDITYLGDENYNMNSTTCDFTIVEPAKENTPISMDIVTYEDEVWMTVSVDDAATGLVKFQVTGPEEFTLYVDVIDGKALVDEVLLLGDYNVIVTYMGDARFNTNITYGEFTIKGHIKKDTPISAHADVLGNRVTLTVNVDDEATGFVKLAISGTVTNIEVVDGVAKLTTTLPANSYYVDVTYLGDNDFNMNNTRVTFTVTDVAKKDTPIDLNIVTYEDAAWITVDLDKAATGLVKFYMVWEETGEESTVYMDVVDGHVETFTNSIAPGNYTVVATYMGDSVFNTNTTSGDVEILGHVLMDTPITANVVSNGNRVTLTAKVDEDATGFVELKFGDNVFNIAVNDGIATLTTSLPYGSYSLDITYLGDENFNKNSTKLEFTLVEPAKENTPISMDIVTYEDEVWMTVSVDDAATGLVKFQVTGPEEFALYVDVIDGKAIVDEVLLTGDYSVVATFMGDARFNTNVTSGEFTISGHIKKDTPISARADVIGSRVTLTVNVDEDATGFVKLTISGTVVNVEVVDGVAKLTTTLPANSYFADVTYLGDEDYNMNSTQVTFTITEVSKQNTTIDLDIAVYEDTALVMVDVNKAATGLVKLYMVWEETGETYTMYMDVIDGHVETLTNLIEPGNYTIVATYMGDSVFNTNATSKDVEIIGHIKKDTPIDANVETSGNNLTLTVKVDENATGFVEVKYNDTVFNIALNNGTGVLNIALPTGSYNLDITYLGDENFNQANTSQSFNIGKKSSEFKDITVSDNGTVVVVLVDGDGKGIANVNVSYTINGELKTTTTNDKGEIVINATSNSIVVIDYAGDDQTLPANVVISLKDLTPVRRATSIIADDYTTYAIDYYVGERGGYYKVKLVDDSGNLLANKAVKIGFNGRVYNTTTDSEGIAKLQINLIKAGTYTFAVAFLGDENFNASFRVNSITVNLKKTSISAAAKSFKASAKTKSYTVTLKTDKGSSIDGKTYMASGKTVKLTVNGKTYTAKTNAKGQATFKLNINKKGVYNASVNFAGDSTYKSCKATTKITIN